MAASLVQPSGSPFYGANGSGAPDIASVIVGSGHGLVVNVKAYNTEGTGFPTISGVTWNGSEPLTAVAASQTRTDSDGRELSSRWFYIANPTPGTATLSVSVSGHINATAVAWVVSGHDTSTMTAGLQSSASLSEPPSVGVTLTTVAGDLALFNAQLRGDVSDANDAVSATSYVNLPYNGSTANYVWAAYESASGTSTPVTYSNYNTYGWAEGIVVKAASATAPTAPTGPTASSVTSQSFAATWTDASSDETSFDVQYAPAPYTSWTTMTGSPTAANATSLASGNVLADGTSYRFRVRSTNANGSSAWVESGVFTTLSLTRLRPNADTTVGSATSTGANLFGVLDETVADDADYITIPGTLTSIALIQGHPSETTIKTWTPSPGATFATSTLTLTSGEASAITDYAALYVKIVTSSTTVKMKFENATDPANDNDHALVIRLRAA